jgi:acyl-CoA thioester hydrolase
MAAFILPLIIAPDDIDVLGHVNNVVYVRWAQEAATAHWTRQAGPELAARYVWVVTRHEIDYMRQIGPGETVEARTWVAQAPHGALFARTVEIWSNAAPKPCARIVSQWCLLDAESRRIRRITPEILERFKGFTGP